MRRSQCVRVKFMRCTANTAARELREYRGSRLSIFRAEHDAPVSLAEHQVEKTELLRSNR